MTDRFATTRTFQLSGQLPNETFISFWAVGLGDRGKRYAFAVPAGPVAVAKLNWDNRLPRFLPVLGFIRPASLVSDTPPHKCDGLMAGAE